MLTLLKTLVLSSLLAASSAALADPRLAASETDIRPILLGSPLPDAAVLTLAGKRSTLKEVVHGAPAVVVFYRGGWCPYCNLQLSELQKVEGQLQELGYQVIAISPDLPGELKQTLENTPLKYTLVSDGNAEASRAFGIAYRLDEKTFRQYRDWGIYLDKRSGSDLRALPVPAVFIVDADGTIQFSYVHPDYKVRTPAVVVVEAARAIAQRKHRLKP